MRGRIDVAERLIDVRRETGPLSTNLVQTPIYDSALKKAFAIVGERNVSPTLGMEILPVCIVEDLRDAIRGTAIRFISAQRVVGAAGFFPTAWIRCAPSGPTVLRADDDGGPARVIIDRIQVRSNGVFESVIIDPAIHINDAYAVPPVGTESRPAMANNYGNYRYPGAFPATSNPTLGLAAEFYSAPAFGAAANGQITIRVDQNPFTEILGPIVLEPNYACIVSTSVALGGPLNLYYIFEGRAFPS